MATQWLSERAGIYIQAGELEKLDLNGDPEKHSQGRLRRSQECAEPSKWQFRQREKHVQRS